VQRMISSESGRSCMQPPPTCPPCKSRLVLGLAEGAHHLHGMGFAHRDIKPGNVLVFGSEEEGFHAVLADFGFAAGDGDRSIVFLTSNVGCVSIVKSIV